mmetsp:Transcript_24816/g.44207  ORF Transcript_24816/g.44207 Transcript_24816/m.44207 type:complete len:86 (-) Transcript_24816:432-689(-)
MRGMPQLDQIQSARESLRCLWEAVLVVRSAGSSIRGGLRFLCNPPTADPRSLHMPLIQTRPHQKAGGEEGQMSVGGDALRRSCDD